MNLNKFTICNENTFRDVAQLVEYLLWEQEVTSSNLVVPKHFLLSLKLNNIALKVLFTS